MSCDYTNLRQPAAFHKNRTLRFETGFVHRVLLGIKWMGILGYRFSLSSEYCRIQTYKLICISYFKS